MEAEEIVEVNKLKLGADRVTEKDGEDETRYPFIGRWNRHPPQS